MSHLYLAESLDDLEKLAKCSGDFRNLLSDAKACVTLCERVFKDIDVHLKLEDEELACVLYIQLETFLQQALVNVSRDRNRDPDRSKWEETLSNYQQRAAEECNRQKVRLKLRYEKRVAEQKKAQSLIENLFRDRQSPSMPFSQRSARSPSPLVNLDSDLHVVKVHPAAPPGLSPAQSSTDLAIAASNDSPPDQPIDTYLASSLPDLELFLNMDLGISENISTCSTVGKEVKQAISAAKILRDEELQYVLNKLLAAYMQRSKGMSQKLADGKQNDANEAFFKSYIDFAQRRCKVLEDSLKSRYNKKSALKSKALRLIPNQATLEKWSESTDRLSQSPLHASAEIFQSTQQKTDLQFDQKPERISWQARTEFSGSIGACESNDANIAQVVDDAINDSQALSAVRVRAYHALATTELLSVATSADVIVAVNADSVAVAAASLAAAVVKEERTVFSPAALEESLSVGTRDSNTRTANPQRSSLPGAGIKNRSNDCYMSSILQILNSIPAFIESINEMAQQGSHPLASELASILRHLNDGTEGDLQQLKSVLGATSDGRAWTSSTQQDAHEFFMHLISMLEQNAGGAPACEANSNPPTGERRRSAKEQIEFTVRTFKQCGICNRKSSNDEPMYFFPIDVSDAADEILVIPECLEKFTQPQSVPFCCGNSSTIATNLCSLPDVLILYVKRFGRITSDKSANHVPPAGEHQKLKTAVKFPTENLDLHPLMPRESGASPSGLYSLIGIVNHVGDNLENGHYTAHCKNLKDTLWYLFSDTSVTLLPVNCASTTDAYILFYTRCSSTATEM